MVTIDPRPGSNAIDCGSGPGRLRFTADPKCGSERLWFDCLATMESADGGHDRITVEMEQVDTMLGFDPERPIRPACRVDDGAWERMPPSETVVAPDGRIRLRWSLACPVHSLHIAACPPYGPRDLDALVTATGLSHDAIGVSQAGRLLPRLGNRPGTVGGDEPGVYLLARQHAGEAPGSWVLDGCLRALAKEEAEQETPPLVWTIPFADLDGVRAGRYGKTRWPEDLNRNWYEGGQVHEILTYRTDAERWATRCRPRLMIDFHAPDWPDRDCYFHFRPAHQGQRGRAETFFAACRERFGSRIREPFVRENTAIVELAERIGLEPLPTAQDFFMERWPGLVATTFEISYQELGGRPAGIEDYRRLGADLAATITAWCRDC